ncbi:hypothetical protein Q5P01_009505 [Channa striata]|uniref:Ig-like domain-containing protein n=1 Tax=Channa striata TaxID=64152 RepID=A0AA88SUS9_CHASR|nr:hypothetical protein Q5P01_009505 [Channa striata]
MAPSPVRFRSFGSVQPNPAEPDRTRPLTVQNRSRESCESGPERDRGTRSAHGPGTAPQSAPPTHIPARRRGLGPDLLPMASFICSLLFLFTVAVETSPVVSQSSDPTEPMCYDWGESNEGGVSVMEGESGWLSCPLFSHPSVYNYNSTQNAGHNLFWYRLPEGHDLEQPITYSSRLSKDRERLWLQPTIVADSGLYICMLRNKSSCSKIGMHLKVWRREDAVPGFDCLPLGTVANSHVVIGLQEGKILHCPDLQDAAKMADSEPTVTWYHAFGSGPRCVQFPIWNTDRQQEGAVLHVYDMLDHYQGLYVCTIHYLRRGKALNFSRSINVTAVYPSSLPKEPSILRPTKDYVFTVKQDTEVHLVCSGLFPYLNSSGDIWWTVDGTTVDKLADHRFSKINRLVKYDYGDRIEESKLVIQDFQAEDLKKEFNCSVKNEKGFETRRAQLVEEVSLPSVELGCGLGVTLFLMLLLFVVYHIFWLELLLLYRSWFGTDERHTDLSETVLNLMQRSRRLLFVLSPDSVAEKSFSLLECRLALYLQHGHLASIITVVYRSVSKLACVEVARLRQAAATTVLWRGIQSEPLRSRFWLRLRLALPVRPLALGRRLIDSTSSHSDLAALALQRVQSIQNQNRRERAHRGHRNRQASASQSSRDWQAPPTGRGRRKRGGTCRKEGSHHSRTCSVCTGFVEQVEASGVELSVETGMQQTTPDGSRIQPKSVPDPVHDTNSAPTPTPEQDSEPEPASLHPAPVSELMIHRHNTTSSSR